MKITQFQPTFICFPHLWVRSVSFLETMYLPTEVNQKLESNGGLWIPVSPLIYINMNVKFNVYPYEKTAHCSHFSFCWWSTWNVCFLCKAAWFYARAHKHTHTHTQGVCTVDSMNGDRFAATGGKKTRPREVSCWYKQLSWNGQGTARRGGRGVMESVG